MTSLSVSYKGCVILAQAELVGRGGTRVPASERQYAPLAMVLRATEADDAPQALELFRTKGQTSLSNPYAAMMTAVQCARELVDAIVEQPALGGAPAVGEFNFGGVHWRWDSLNMAQGTAVKSPQDAHRLTARSKPVRQI